MALNWNNQIWGYQKQVKVLNNFPLIEKLRNITKNR